jgi:N4-gp56 family major capsid protein
MASLTTSSTLSGLMQIFYDKVFLDRAEMELRYDYGAQKKTMPKNSGKTIYFNRFSPLGLATTALTENTNPSGVDMSSTVVSATIAEYGNYTRVSSLFEMTSLDEGLKEHVEVMSQNAGETLDALIAAELSGGSTAQIVSGKALTAVAATDTLTGAEIRKAVRTLKKNKAKTFEDGLFRAIIPVSAAYDLRGNSEWLNANTYVNVDLYKNGQVGVLHGVRFVETNNEVYEASTVNVYHTYVFGKNAYGTLNLAGQPEKRIMVKNPGDSDTSNPLNMYSTIGWKSYFVAKVLNSAWVIAIKTGVTA